MHSTDLLRMEDLVNNPVARVPICLCLDTSASMGGQPINDLNEGVRLFYDEIRSDEIAMYSAEVCIVTFGGAAQLVADFASLERQSGVAPFQANGATPMGEAVNIALDCLEKRKQEYKNKGVDYFQPWLVLMTDGEPNGSVGELSRAVSRTVDLVNTKKLIVFPIGIGKEADMATLAKFSPKRSPAKLKETNFQQFFQWLSQSVSKTSQSMPGEKVELDYSNIKSWGVF